MAARWLVRERHFNQSGRQGRHLVRLDEMGSVFEFQACLDTGTANLSSEYSDQLLDLVSDLVGILWGILLGVLTCSLIFQWLILSGNLVGILVGRGE